MKGDLERPTFDKGGKTIARRLEPDRVYTSPDGGELCCPAAACCWCATSATTCTPTRSWTREAQPIPEGILDALVTSTIALHDLQGPGDVPQQPHGLRLHRQAEDARARRGRASPSSCSRRSRPILGLPENTLKIGVMDEERRTTVNLAACIHAARHRIVFINTGFLDRTGDEIHTAMEGGPMVRKAEMKTRPGSRPTRTGTSRSAWPAGLKGRAQIGKGMWAAPDRMADMLAQKIGHPEGRRQHRLGAVADGGDAARPALSRGRRVRPPGRSWPARRSRGWTTATPPLAHRPQLRRRRRCSEELENNAQGILGYVVRWVDQGVGCSKVPDIHDVGLMEDRATLRISSQLMANWLRHGVITTEQVEADLRRMAAVVDRQNAGDPDYTPMAPAVRRARLRGGARAGVRRRRPNRTATPSSSCTAAAARRRRSRPGALAPESAGLSARLCGRAFPQVLMNRGKR